MMNTIKKLLGSVDTAEEPLLAPANDKNIGSQSSGAPAYQAWTPTGPTAEHAEPDGATQTVEGETESARYDNSLSSDNALAQQPSPDLESRIIDAIKLVYDPEIPVNIYELGLIYGINIAEDKDVQIQMTLTAPGCPVAGDMPGWVVAAVESNVEEISNVEVELVWDPPWNPELMSEAAQLELGYF